MTVPTVKRSTDTTACPMACKGAEGGGHRRPLVHELG